MLGDAGLARRCWVHIGECLLGSHRTRWHWRCYRQCHRRRHRHYYCTTTAATVLQYDVVQGRALLLGKRDTRAKTYA